MPDCTIVILSYKGLKHLEHLLPTVKEVIQYTANYTVEVLIVENGEDLISEKFVADNHPSFKFIYSPKNEYLFSLNSIICELTSKYIFILNNDLRLHHQVLNVTLPILERDLALFAVSCTLKNWEGNHIQEAVKTIQFKNGWMYISHAPFEKKVRYTFNACGGASVYRTEMFNELGGFDRLYYPAYYEDTDLSHRAWQRGWKIINHPDAVVFHREGGSWKNEAKQTQLNHLIARNKILGMVKNNNFRYFLTLFFVFLPFRMILYIITNRDNLISMLKAIKLLPLALSKRDTSNVLNDIQISKYLNKDYHLIS